jgi:hypothetical protein
MDINSILNYQNFILKLKQQFIHHPTIIPEQSFIQLNHKCHHIINHLTHLQHKN